MPLFVLTALDKPNSLDLRMATRQAHLDYVRSAERVKVKLGGPLLDAAGEMAGSMAIIEADDLAAVEGFAAQDPYRLAGLFEKVEIRGYKVTVGAL